MKHFRIKRRPISFLASLSLLALSLGGIINAQSGNGDVSSHDYSPGEILSIEEAVDYNLNNYPEATLADLYKSFYQDVFGPGHLLNDSAGARNYYNSELSDTSRWSGPVYEPTGQGLNFVRVNMDLVRNGTIPADVLFNAFVNSLQKIERPDDETWISLWAVIDSVASSSGKVFNNEAAEREMIAKKIEDRNFTMHHSAGYDSIYRFHYRIISIPVFNETILPYLKP